VRVTTATTPFAGRPPEESPGSRHGCIGDAERRQRYTRFRGSEKRATCFSQLMDEVTDVL